MSTNVDPIGTGTGRWLLCTHQEIERARARLAQPAWQPAAKGLADVARRAAERWHQLPTFDHRWYDENPQRDFAQTYDLFAAYIYPARNMAQAMDVLLIAAAVLDEPEHHRQAMRLARHMVEHVRFHVQHHDAGLCYAMVGVGLAQAYAAGQAELGEEERGAFGWQLEACGEAIRASTQHWLSNLGHMAYNNHFAHHRRGLLAVGIALGREEWIDEALNGPRNFGELLVGCTMDDGLCYESSTLYHFATLGALAQIAELVRCHGGLGRDLYHETFANGRRLKDMFDAPLGMLLPGGELPSVGDCYARRAPLAQRQAGLYERAWAIYGDERYAWLLAQAGPRTHWQSLVHGADDLEPARPPAVRSRLWLEHGYALLASEHGPDYWHKPAVAAFVTGNASGIHHHRDTLSVQVGAAGRVWLDDAEAQAVEQQTFAAPIQRAFNRTMLAHNVVIVDEQDQRTHRQPLEVVEFKDLPACRTVALADAGGRLYPGVAMMRTLAVVAGGTDAYCLDVFQVRSEAQHVYDWLVHPRADEPATTSPAIVEPFELPRREPYSVLSDVRAAAETGPGVSLAWAQGDASFRADVTVSGGARLIRAARPVRSDGEGGTRELFMVRTRGAAATFVALYQLEGKGKPWQVLGQEPCFNGEFHELRIVVGRGDERVEHTLKALPAR